MPLIILIFLSLGEMAGGSMYLPCTVSHRQSRGGEIQDRRLPDTGVCSGEWPTLFILLFDLNDFFRTVLIASAKTIYYTYWMTKTNINKLALCYLYCVYKLTKWYKTSAEFERYYTHCFIIRYYVTTWWSGWVEAGIPWSTTWINMTPVGADFPVRILVEFK